jgi:hypothetical protein
MRSVTAVKAVVIARPAAATPSPRQRIGTKATPVTPTALTDIDQRRGA